MKMGLHLSIAGKGKILAKLKIFLWLVANNAISIKDNMLKRNWKGSPSYYFYDQDENAKHLLFSCCIAKVVWTTIVVCLGASDIPKSSIQCWR